MDWNSSLPKDRANLGWANLGGQQHCRQPQFPEDAVGTKQEGYLVLPLPTGVCCAGQRLTCFTSSFGGSQDIEQVYYISDSVESGHLFKLLIPPSPASSEVGLISV